MTIDSPVCTAAWAADDRLYTGHRDGSVWRRDASGQTSRVQLHAGEVVALAADEHGVVSAGADHRLLRLDAELSPVGELPLPNREALTVRLLAVSRTRVAALLAPTLAPSVLAVWRRVDGKGVFARRVSDGFATGLAIAPDDSFVATASSDDHIVVWRDGIENRLPGRSQGQENFIRALTIPEPTTIVCASRIRSIRRIELASGRTTHLLDYRAAPDNVLVRCVDDRILVVTSGGSFAVWSLAAREVIASYALPLANWTAIAANASANQIFATSKDATVIVELHPH